MEFSFSDEQKAICELARQIFSDCVSHERLKEVEASEDRIDRSLWSELADANLLGVSVPEEAGGMGFGIFELALLLEEAGRAVAPVPLFSTLVLGALPLAAFGSAAQRQAYLPSVATGGISLSAALAEAGSSYPERPRLFAKPAGEDWILSGEKICVPFAKGAARILVPAATGEDCVGVFLLDPDSEGVALEFEETTSLEPQFTLRLENVRVAASDILGDPCRGAEIVTWLLDRALIGLSAMQLGVAEEALRRTAEYTAERTQFGRPIGSFQGVSLRAADAYIDVEAMRSVLWQAAWRVAEGRDSEKEVAAAKWWACEAGHRVVHTALHLHGGVGADLDFPLHRYAFWAKQISTTLGGANQQLARIGERLARSG